LRGRVVGREQEGALNAGKGELESSLWKERGEEGGREGGRGM